MSKILFDIQVFFEVIKWNKLEIGENKIHSFTGKVETTETDSKTYLRASV